MMLTKIFLNCDYLCQLTHLKNYHYDLIYDFCQCISIDLYASYFLFKSAFFVKLTALFLLISFKMNLITTFVYRSNKIFFKIDSFVYQIMTTITYTCLKTKSYIKNVTLMTSSIFLGIISFIDVCTFRNINWIIVEHSCIQ